MVARLVLVVVSSSDVMHFPGAAAALPCALLVPVTCFAAGFLQCATWPIFLLTAFRGNQNGDGQFVNSSRLPVEQLADQVAKQRRRLFLLLSPVGS